MLQIQKFCLLHLEILLQLSFNINFFAFEHMCINAQCCYYFICWQVPPASVMTIVKEVDPTTTRTTANTTLTRNFFSTDTSNLAAGSNSSQEPINSLSKEKATGMNGYL